MGLSGSESVTRRYRFWKGHPEIKPGGGDDKISYDAELQEASTRDFREYANELPVVDI